MLKNKFLQKSSLTLALGSFLLLGTQALAMDPDDHDPQSKTPPQSQYTYDPERQRTQLGPSTTVTAEQLSERHESALSPNITNGRRLTLQSEYNPFAGYAQALKQWEKDQELSIRLNRPVPPRPPQPTYPQNFVITPFLSQSTNEIEYEVTLPNGDLFGFLTGD